MTRLLCILVLILGPLACSRQGDLRVLRTLRVGAQPEGLALSPDGRLLAVACQRSNDVWITALAGGVPFRIDTGPAPQDLMFSPDGTKLLVAESGGESVAQVSLSERRVTRRFKVQPQPLRMEAVPGGGRMLVTSLTETGVGVYGMPGFRAEKSIPLEGLAERVLSSPDGKELLAVTRESPAFVRIRMADLSHQSSLLVKGSPVDLALSPEGDFAWVAGEGKFFDQETEGEASPGWLSCIRLSDNRLVDFAPICSAVRSVAAAPSGRWLYAVCGEEGELLVVDAGNLAVKARLSLPGDPAELHLSKNGSELYVAQRDLKQISIIGLGRWK
jgi:DNA-binding beta-propeller fold protein YncE